MNDTVFELSKMAVTDGVQGLGIGRKLMEPASKQPKKTKSKDYHILNRRLVPAISLYEKFGFEEIPWKRCLRKPILNGKINLGL
jgi:GNAT superfamily N-acetyltransferase